MLMQTHPVLLYPGNERPRIVECRGKCNTVYCSAGCEDDAWQKYHALLCTGTPPPPGEGSSAGAGACADGPAAAAGGSPEQATSKGAKSIHALEAFLEMADVQNDHLRIAAKVVSCTVAEARRRERGGEPTAAALAGAWAPWRQGVKAMWWDTAMKEDGTADKLSHEDFQAEVRRATVQSLELLKTALPAAAADYPGLFSLEVWSSILGMLDLNCKCPDVSLRTLIAPYSR